MGRAEELTSAIMKHEVRIIHDIEMVNILPLLNFEFSYLCQQ